MTWIEYALILSGYYALHSVMASSQLKSFFHNLSIGDQSYRILFNLIALATTYLVILAYLDTVNDIDYQGSRLGFIPISGGLGLVIYAIWNYDMLAFLGLKKEEKYDDLITSGLNNHVRHPLYLGIIITFIGWLIYRPSEAAMVTLVVTVLYIQIGIYFEEMKLIAQFGKSYEDYKKNIPKLIPSMKKAQE